MPILPLPQFEADLEADRLAYEKLKPPTSIVVRFGIMKLVGEFPYSGDAKPGCGSKLVIRTNRGTEMGEMLTSTCPNAGCSKSVSRKEMLEYIDNSGGKDYPFFNQGRILRIASLDDLNQQTRLDASRPKLVMEARQIVGELNLPMKVVDAEPLLGGERLSYYYTSEDRVDFRDLVARLAPIYHTRIEMRQVGARDEARLVADYERCGQHCCCKQFLKVLKPVSMRSAKIQKATLDPLKISGRCGRLMCCLRYEDETYDDLRKRLPRKKSRVMTPHGWGIVIDAQILTQLVLVRLESDNTDVAVPVEELGAGPSTATGLEGDIETETGEEPGTAPAPRPAADRPARPDRPQTPPPQARRDDRPPRLPGSDRPPQDRDRPPQDRAPAPAQRRERPQDRPREPRPPQDRQQRPRPSGPPAAPPSATPGASPPVPPRDDRPPRDPNAPESDSQRRRRRRRRRSGPGGESGGEPGGHQGGPNPPPSSPPPGPPPAT